MGRSDLERLSKEELIELALQLQGLQKTSPKSSEPPSTDRKEPRECSKTGHEGRSRILLSTPYEVVEHRPNRFLRCEAVQIAD